MAETTLRLSRSQVHHKSDDKTISRYVKRILLHCLQCKIAVVVEGSIRGVSNLRLRAIHIFNRHISFPMIHLSIAAVHTAVLQSINISSSMRGFPIVGVGRFCFQSTHSLYIIPLHSDVSTAASIVPYSTVAVLKQHAGFQPFGSGVLDRMKDNTPRPSKVGSDCSKSNDVNRNGQSGHVTENPGTRTNHPRYKKCN